MTKWLRALWHALREVSGDDAYERYLAHRRVHHAEAAPLDRSEFFKERERRKWQGVNKCC